ncbi:hypothetical protein ACOMHN_062980 [Nucella lapillus]
MTSVLCDWRMTLVMCDWRMTSVLCDWRMTSVLCDWRMTSVLCDWRMTSVLCDWRMTVLCDWRITSVLCDWRMTAVLCDWRMTTLDGHEPAALKTVPRKHVRPSNNSLFKNQFGGDINNLRTDVAPEADNEVMWMAMMTPINCFNRRGHYWRRTVCDYERC